MNDLTGKKYRLPTEAEWEFAASGGNLSQKYKYSGSNNLKDVAWFYDNSGECTHIVGAKSPNELGIYGMSGNVNEWCSDKFGAYLNSSQKDPKGTSSGNQRVIRGGAYNSSEGRVRILYRSSFKTGNFDSPALGFRLVYNSN